MSDNKRREDELREQLQRLKQNRQTGRIIDDLPEPSNNRLSTGSLGDFYPEEATKIMLPSVANAQDLNLYLPGMTRPLVVTADEEVSVGRSNPASDFIPDLDLIPYKATELGVSRYHGTISAKGGQFVYKDMGSTNGSFINERRLAPFQWHQLRFKDRLRLGYLILTVG